MPMPLRVDNDDDCWLTHFKRNKTNAQDYVHPRVGTMRGGGVSAGQKCPPACHLEWLRPALSVQGLNAQVCAQPLRFWGESEVWCTTCTAQSNYYCALNCRGIPGGQANFCLALLVFLRTSNKISKNSEFSRREPENKFDYIKV